MSNNFSKEQKWYAVYTRARWEKKVADQLTKMGIEHYCPLNRVIRQWSDRKKLVEVPFVYFLCLCKRYRQTNEHH